MFKIASRLIASDFADNNTFICTVMPHMMRIWKYQILVQNSHGQKRAWPVLGYMMVLAQK